MLDAADFETLYGRDQGRTQRSSEHDLERSCTQFDSFRRHDNFVLHDHVGNHSTLVGLDPCETMRQALVSS